MTVPDNEGKACDAVVRILEKWTGSTRADIRYPEQDGVGPPVDLRLKLGTQEYAVEHTRIEPFENQIKTSIVSNEIIGHIRRNIPDPFPSLACYELQLPIDVSLPKGKAKRDRALNNLVDWIRANEQLLRERNLNGCALVRNPYVSDDIQGTPEGFNCVLELVCWPNADFIGRRRGTVEFSVILPDDFKNLLIGRLGRAFSRKCPKLHACKTEGVRTVLVLESSDAGPGMIEFRDRLLPSLLGEHTNAPDEIFLLETCLDEWSVWLIKRDADHWPKTGMPEFNGIYYEPGNSPAEHTPKRIRDALQLDKLYTLFSPGWAPSTFNKDELNELTQSRGMKKATAAGHDVGGPGD